MRINAFKNISKCMHVLLHTQVVHICKKNCAIGDCFYSMLARLGITLPRHLTLWDRSLSIFRNSIRKQCFIFTSVGLIYQHDIFAHFNFYLMLLLLIHFILFLFIVHSILFLHLYEFLSTLIIAVKVSLHIF